MKKNVNRALVAKKKFSKFSLTLLAGLLLTFAFPLQGWAGGGSTYYSRLKAIGSAGKGYVYASKESSATPEYLDMSESEQQSSGTSQTEDTFYAWAKAVRGHDFDGWTKTSGSPTIAEGSTNPFTVKVKESNTADGTNTGVITANWTMYTEVNVTYNPSDYGVYSVTYQYNSYDADSKTIITGDAEGLSRNITSENGAQTIGSYHNDVITLKSESGDFQGWYSDPNFNTLLSSDNPYTYVAPESGTGSVYAQYPHVDKYYGRLTASIAAVPYSMPAGGMIFISTEASASPVYSENAQTEDNVGMGTTDLTYYLKAQPTDKRYVFRGWYSNPECTGTALSTDKEYTYTFTASSTNSGSPTLGNIYAAFDFNLFYIEVQAQPATPGLGMVLVSDQSLGTPDYTQYSNESSQFLYAYRGAPTANAYLYAKPKYGYKFSGWYSNPECTGTALSTSATYTYTTTGLSTDPMTPTIVSVYAKFIPSADGDKISITYNIPDKMKGEYSASVLDIAEIDDEYVWTFTEVYNSADYAANTPILQYKSDVLRLEAAPNEGYGVTSWTEGSTTKTTPSSVYETTGNAAKTLSVAFGDAKPFLVCANASATEGTPYATLREALDNLGNNKKIVVVQNAYIPAGNYTIPSGVTLLVPYSSEYVIGANQPTKSSGTTAPSPYCMLTIANGAHINVLGAISVNAILRDQQNSNSAPTGACGMITMESGSQIELQSGANMYVWGCVLGTGDIIAHSGSTVYEALQANDYPGGTFLMMQNSTLAQKKIFPIRIYCVLNIQAHLHIEYGAQEKLSVAFASMDAVHNIAFIGSTSGLFRLTPGASLTKWYDKANDRQCYSVNGNASIESISLKVQSAIEVNSGNYLMPITHNMQIDILSGTTTIKNNIEMLPGAIVNIEKDAIVDINQAAEVHVYDKDEWNVNHTFAKGVNKSIVYGRTKTMSYAKNDLEDAKLDVKGSVIVNGALYTTTTGGDVSGHEGGAVVVNAIGTKTVINQVYEKGSTSQEYHTVDISAAKLHNGDGSYVATAGSTLGDKFIYSEEQEQWLRNPMTVSWNANGGDCEVKSNVYAQMVFLGELPVAYREGYTFEGWFTTADGGSRIEPTTKVNGNVTYYAHWTPEQYNITYKDQGKAPFSGTHIDEPNAHPTTHTYGLSTTLNGVVNDKIGYTFGGWHTISNCKPESKVTFLAGDGYIKDIMLYAKWNVNQYTITFNTKGGSEVAAITQDYNTAIVAPANPTKTGYTFKEWIPAVPATMPAENVTITAQWTINQYDITWKNADGTTLTTTKVNYNETPVYSGAAPTKAATAEYTYTFDEWTPAITAVTEDATYTATYSKTLRSYTITFQNEDGTELQKSDVEYGTTPSYTGATPIKAATAEYTYTFKDWDKEIVPVTGAATYTATYSKTLRSYTITWQDENGVELSHETINYGVVPTHAALTKAADVQYSYTWNGWNTTPVAVTGDATYKSLGFTQTKQKYTLTWDLDGGEVKTAGTPAGSVEWGTSLIAPVVEKTGYTFAGWDKEIPATMPAEDMTITANWTAVPTTAKYTVKHYKLHINGGKQFKDPFKTDESEVEIGSEVTPEFEVIEGYDPPAKDTTITISANPEENVVIYEYPISKDNTLNADGNIDAETEAYTVILAPGKTMNITGDGSVTAQNLVLQSVPGDNTGANLATTDNLKILGDVCIEIDMNKSGTMNDKLFYCFSVPFKVNVADGVERLHKDNNTWSKAVLNTNYRVYTYNEYDRATNGRSDNNWASFSDSQFVPGVFYLCEFDNSNYNRYRFYAADKDLDNKENIAVSNSKTGNKDGGWNGVANNGLTNNKLSGDFTIIQTLNSVKNSFESAKADKKPLAIGNAAMVQVSKEGSVVVGETPSAVAARRMGETASTEFINVRLYKENQDQHVDQIFIRASEDASEQYVAGIDLSKATIGTPKVARLWVNDYDLQLVANEALMSGDQAVFSLGMSAPANGEYTIALNEVPNDATIYLTENGSAIWNLNIAPAPISLSKGTENSYGLRLVRKINNVVTGFDEAVLNGNVQKVILNDHLYIIRDSKVYSAHGHVIK